MVGPVETMLRLQEDLPKARTLGRKVYST